MWLIATHLWISSDSHLGGTIEILSTSHRAISFRGYDNISVVEHRSDWIRKKRYLLKILQVNQWKCIVITSGFYYLFKFLSQSKQILCPSNDRAKIVNQCVPIIFRLMKSQDSIWFDCELKKTKHRERHLKYNSQFSVWTVAHCDQPSIFEGPNTIVVLNNREIR